MRLADFWITWKGAAICSALIPVALTLVGQGRTLADTISVNGTCEVGTCATPDVLAVGNSTSIGYNFDFELGDGDIFGFVGSFSAVNSIGGFSSGNSVTVAYLGNQEFGSVASQSDVLTLDSTQGFASSLTAFDGAYTSKGQFNGFFGTGTNVVEQVFVDGQSAGIVGPFTSSWSTTSSVASLSGLTDPLYRDLELTFDIDSGTAVGANIGVNTPEPSTVFLIPSAFLAAFIARKRIARVLKRLPSPRE